jgi:alginate O-acetyltransferase complex protein AlgI
MLFTSPTFLFYFLPVTVALYFLALRVSLSLANLILLLLSILFYSWGELVYLPLFLSSLLLNYLTALALSKFQSYRKLVLALGIGINLSILIFFKYVPAIFDFNLRLPLGISFFTFHGISYIVDIYRGSILLGTGIIETGLYIALFPQLIAGPIIRYKEISKQLFARSHSAVMVEQGIARFIIGLAKKTLIANEMALVADRVFSIDSAELSTASAWLGIVAYSLQIYFDFSGYSDMAIGLGRIFGFQFPENFNLPYTARSIREFWQRWHITLSLWFRDYLYIPLGGNRGGELKTARNLLIVFLLCGLWHGASWNFVLWGALHGMFLSLERTKFSQLIGQGLIARSYTLLVVVLLWVPFRADTLEFSIIFWKALFSLTSASFTINKSLFIIINLKFIVVLFFAILLSFGLLESGLRKNFFCLAVLFLLSLSSIAAGSYNPFIYFRF